MGENGQSYRRILLLLGMSLLFFGCLGIQLLRIQLIGYYQYTRAASRQRHLILLKQQLKGSVVDREFRILRGSTPAKYLLVINNRNIHKKIQKLAPDFGAEFIREYCKNRSKKYWIYSRFLTSRQVQLIKRFRSSALQLISGLSQREQKMLAWHLLGMNNSNEALSGLESSYQTVLRKTGYSQEVFAVLDGFQAEIPGLGLRVNDHPATGGLVLTLDSRIQRIVEETVDQEKLIGAVVVLDVQTGEILAMVSRPMINLDDIEGSLSNKEAPFLNRAISAYHPGSLFKLVILSAGLDSGILKKDDEFFDPGYYRIGTEKWVCTTSFGQGHRQITLKDALAYSCNTVFIEVAIRLKPRLILDYAEKFGFGLPCNIGLLNESWGELPSGNGLSLGEQANLALGQQLIMATPLQIASMVQTIANDGIRIKPYLVKGYFNRDGSYTRLSSAERVKVLEEDTARNIQQMMAAVTSYGTGTEAQVAGGAAGKTGTAQIGSRENLPDHAWFAAYAPLNNPRYVTVVFCEKGISGGKTAAPIFKEIMEKVNRLQD